MGPAATHASQRESTLVHIVEEPVFTLSSTFTMADKIVARNQLVPERGYMDEQWNQKSFKRAFKLCVF